MEMLKSQWAHHNLSLHNDLGWLKGTEKPVSKINIVNYVFPL
jgi:cytochrome b subunit of formate dehydrogenase